MVGISVGWKEAVGTSVGSNEGIEDSDGIKLTDGGRLGIVLGAEVASGNASRYGRVMVK